jgi:hypothetical protein
LGGLVLATAIGLLVGRWVVSSVREDAFCVAGPSMSPTLWGPHRLARCGRCGWSHRVHLQPRLSALRLRCFRCGSRRLEVGNEVFPGDRVRLDRDAFEHRAPRRGELVAVRRDDGSLQVKRLLGLPGDVFRIDGRGRLWINGRHWLPEPEQAWRRAIEVFPAPHGGGLVENRWRLGGAGPDAPQSEWQPYAGGWQIAIRAKPTGWLVYHHRNVQRMWGPDTAQISDAIRDDDPANVGLRRVPQPVTELYLQLSLRVTGRVRLGLRYWSPAGTRCADVPLTGNCREVQFILREETLWWRCAAGPERFQRLEPRSLDASQEDRVVCVAERPVAITFADRGSAEEPGRVQLDRLWLGRGVRYDPPPALRERWAAGVRVPLDRYLVFGDNPPNSKDSRAEPAGIPRVRLVGTIEPLGEPGDAPVSLPPSP